MSPLKCEPSQSMWNLCYERKQMSRQIWQFGPVVVEKKKRRNKKKKLKTKKGKAIELALVNGLNPGVSVIGWV